MSPLFVVNSHHRIEVPYLRGVSSLTETVPDSAEATQEDRMVRVFAPRFLSSVLLILWIDFAAAAQTLTTGRLTGTVTDPQGAVIPRAEILAKNVPTGSEFRTFANGTGVWVLFPIPAGSYEISVSARGFRTATLKETTVDMKATATLDVTLQIGIADTAQVTASKIEEEIINAPATATVISEESIRALPTQNIADLFRGVPGMNVIQTSAREFSVNSRSASGLLPSAFLALIDGRTIYADSSAYVRWDGLTMNLDEIKQVEVIRGPASAIWGANAMNGLVNIITRRPREMLGTVFTLGIGTFDRSGGVAESNRGNLYYASVMHAQALNDRWAFKISGSAYTQDAFARPQGTIANPYHTPYPPLKNPGTTQPKVDARADYDLPDGKQHFAFSGGYSSTGGILFSDALLKQGSGMGYGKVDYIRGALRITGYANLLSATTTSQLSFGLDGQPIQGYNKSQTYHVEFSNSGMIQSKHLISYGGNYRHNNFNDSTAPEGKNRDDGGAYFQDEILLSKHFRWVVAARIDKFDNLKGVVFSPRTTFMVKPSAGQTFRLSYNRAYMAPSMIMNFYDMYSLYQIDLGLLDPQLAGNYYSFPLHAMGNRDLEEQSLNAYEAGYTATVANGRASLGAAFYINDSKGDFTWVQTDSYTSQNPPPDWPLPPFVLDLLIANNAFGPGMGLPSAASSKNRGEARNKGLELNADVRLSRYLSGSANYSWQARPESKEFDASVLNQPPTHRFNAGFSFDYQRYLGNISVGYVGSAYWNDVISILYSGTTEAYTVVNLSGGVRWGSGGKYMAMLKISNLANTPIQNHVFGDILKRQITGEFRARF
jgi:outer membrane receptor for ferrienterochelin and colicin